MRHEIQVNLRPLVDQRLQFSTTVKYRQTKPTTRRRVIGRQGKEEILLTNVCLLDTRQLAFKQLWKDAGAWSQSLKIGDRITFDATVATKKEHGTIPPTISCTLNRLHIVSQSP